jgi:hypothetical protein
LQKQLRHPANLRAKTETVQNIVKNLVKITANAKEELQLAQIRQKRFVDKNRREIQFSVGENVLLSTKYIKGKYGRSKLTKRFIGPFKIVEKVGDVSYKLDMKQFSDKLHIHDVIHASNLRKFYTCDDKIEDIYIDIDLESDLEEF